MVLGSEDHVFHTRFFGSRSPLFRIEISGVKSGLEGLHTLSHTGYNWPRRDLSVWSNPPSSGQIDQLSTTPPLAISAPVHEDAELQVPPLFQLLPYQAVSRYDITIIEIVFLSMQSSDEEQRKENQESAETVHNGWG